MGATGSGKSTARPFLLYFRETLLDIPVIFAFPQPCRSRPGSDIGRRLWFCTNMSSFQHSIDGSPVVLIDTAGLSNDATRDGTETFRQSSLPPSSAVGSIQAVPPSASDAVKTRHFRLRFPGSRTYEPGDVLASILYFH